MIIQSVGKSIYSSPFLTYRLLQVFDLSVLRKSMGAALHIQRETPRRLFTICTYARADASQNFSRQAIDFARKVYPAFVVAIEGTQSEGSAIHVAGYALGGFRLFGFDPSVLDSNSNHPEALF